LGSAVSSFVALDEDSSAVFFAPDVIGNYQVRLTVASPYQSSDPVVANVFVQSLLVPQTLRLTPDGHFPFKVLGDFWQLVEDRELFATLWSGMIQANASDILRAIQVDYAKSIKDIQPLYQRRWLSYESRLDLAPESVSAVLGYHQSGTAAFTLEAAAALSGTLLSVREFYVSKGSVSSAFIGGTLRLLSSNGIPGNIGNYTIRALNADSSGYLITADQLFPAPTDEILTSGTDLLSIVGSSTVSSAVDFVAAGVTAGDLLLILTGADSGVYEILSLPTNLSLELDGAATRTATSLQFRVLKKVRAASMKVAEPFTNVVRIRESEANLLKYVTEKVPGKGTLVSPTEIIPASRHVSSALIGKSLRVLSGLNGSRSFTLANLNNSATGFIVSSPFLGTFPQEISYELPVVSSIADRLLILDGEAHAIASVALDTSQPPEVEGGTGPVWVISLRSKTAPAGQEGIEWRISSTLTAVEELETLGVSRGDLLMFEVERLDASITGLLPCVVLGAVGTAISFDLGVALPTTGTNGALEGAELLSLVQDLQVPTATDDNGTTVLSLIAADVNTYLQSLSFERANFNLPVTRISELDMQFFSIRFKSAYIIRNTRIPVDVSLTSVPVLSEFIEPPAEGLENGKYVIVAKDGTSIVRDFPAVEMLENREFTLTPDTIEGQNAAITVDGISIPQGDLVSRDVHVGDTFYLDSGASRGTYRILWVGPDSLIVMSDGGVIPSYVEAELDFRIVRRVPGSFLRVTPGRFSPAAPMPERLWAETSLFDNSQYIEDNFGVLVGTTKERLDEYGSSQITYKGAVQGLMYAWTTGPTLKNVKVGADILLGLPVSEVAGIIRSIEESYTATTGRILIEDLDDESNPTGLSRIYFYTPVSDSILSEFGGLATNPLTRRVFAVGDVVEAFQSLTNGVIVADYLTEPLWWAGAGGFEGRELQKYHTWQLRVNALVVDSRDMPLVVEFAQAMREIDTKPDIVLVLSLRDDLSISDSLSWEGELASVDDIAFSLESTRITDDDNGSGLQLRLLDIGSFNTRVLFKGHDLVTLAGSGVVTSARGGFIDVPTGPINAFFPNTEMVPSDNTGLPYAAKLDKLPQKLVRVGDVLYITEGPNTARFEITAVTDDSTLTVIEIGTGTLPEMPPLARTITEIAAGTDQRFFIERLDQNPIASGTIDLTGTEKASSPTGNFIWDGVAVDDYLVIRAGGAKGKYRIVQMVGDDPTTGPVDVLDAGKDLILFPAPGIVGTVSFEIYREALLRNPLLAGAGNTALGGQVLTVIGGGVLASFVRPGDELTFQTGVEVGNTYTVIGTDRDTKVLVYPPFASAVAGDSFEIRRQNVYDESPDTDGIYEQLGFAGITELTLLRPMSPVARVLDLNTAGNVANSATDFQVAGVVAGDFLEIGVGYLYFAAAVAFVAEPILGMTSGATAYAIPLFPGSSVLALFDVVGDFQVGENIQGTISANIDVPILFIFHPVPGSGVYEISSAVGGTLTLLENVTADSAALAAEVYTPSADFSFTTGIDVTSLASTDFEALGVLPGDILSIPAGDLVILAVSTVNLVVHPSVIVPVASYTGKILRRLYP
jgi:hypothetical protein